MNKFKFYIGHNNKKGILVTYNPAEIKGDKYEVTEKTNDKIFFSILKKLGRLKNEIQTP